MGAVIAGGACGIGCAAGPHPA
ncbi:MAG: hypothetical protein EOP23_01240 [Hyphomicrobiales bacterium]|nr:MAG: hypothetical protein EOP23_01240 [Hyphomicrobiales bacterium]